MTRVNTNYALMYDAAGKTSALSEKLTLTPCQICCNANKSVHKILIIQEGLLIFELE